MLTPYESSNLDAPTCKISYMSKSLGDRIKTARLAAQKSQQQLGDAAGISRSAVAQWESGETKNIRPGHLFRAARFLGVSPEWLATGRGPQAQVREEPPAEYSRRVPLADPQSAADPHTLMDNYRAGERMEEIIIYGEVDYGEDAFAFRVSDEAMVPEFSPGDVVIIDPSREPRPGSFVAGRAGSGAVLVRKYRDRGRDHADNPQFELAPINEDYPTLFISSDNPGTIVGVVVEHHRKFI